jgi:hypothetical protein
MLEGRRLEYVYEATEFEPGVSLTMSTSEGPFPMTTRYIWDAVGDRSTKMTLRNSGVPRGFSRILAPMMESALRRANQ